MEQSSQPGVSGMVLGLTGGRPGIMEQSSQPGVSGMVLGLTGGRPGIMEQSSQPGVPPVLCNDAFFECCHLA